MNLLILPDLLKYHPLLNLQNKKGDVAKVEK